MSDPWTPEKRARARALAKERLTPELRARLSAIARVRWWDRHAEMEKNPAMRTAGDLLATEPVWLTGRGHPWSRQDDHDLHTLIKAKASLRDIAISLGRSPRAIRERLRNAGYSFPREWFGDEKEYERGRPTKYPLCD